MSDCLAHPGWAPALLSGWLFLALLVWLARRRTRRGLRGLAGARLVLGAGRDAALLIALLGLAVALLGPRFGTQSIEVPGNGIDVVLLLDVSRSMDARDTPPSRLARAREAAREVLRGLAPGDRVALAVFAGRAALLTPLTSDREALAEMLPSLDSEMMSDRGSSPALGLVAALDAFEPGSLRPGVILALGDGESAEPVGEAEATQLRRAGVRFVAGAIGSDAGSAIETGVGPVRDARGEPVITRRQTQGFARLADLSGGALLLADAWGSFPAGALLAAARRGLVPGPGGSVRRELPVTHAWLPAGLAFVLLVAELLAADPLARRLRARLAQTLPARLGRTLRTRLGRTLRVRLARLRARVGRRTLAALALTLLAASRTAEIDELEAEVRRDPQDATTLLALGVARAHAGDPAEAARAFEAAAVRARSPGQAALASYDLGVARLEAEDFAGARDAFFDALALAPGDGEAKFNLEWALRALASQPPPPVPGPSERPGDGSPPADAPPPEREPPRADVTPEDAPARETPQAEAGQAAGAPSQASPPLGPEELARWLDAVQDRPLPAFRAALDEGGSTHSGPQW